jgi:hypothetical protein
MQRSYSLFSAVVFALVALIQIVRAVNGWRLQIGDYTIPVSVSWMLAIIAIGLSFWGFRTASQRSPPNV